VTAAYPVPPTAPGPARRVQVFPGEPGQVRRVRAFAACALAGCPAREALLTCVSELAANAIAHTASGAGGVFTVEVVLPAPGVARVAVTDAGAPHEPAIRYPDAPGDLQCLAEGGRGLALVAACSSRWGYRDADEGAGRTVWAEATWPVPVAAPAAR
jgi:anti-sigma regulatory factor (Ser/Thr protein kinase)